MSIGEIDVKVTADREAYYRALRAENLGPLWETLKGLVPAEPRPQAVAFMWSYSDVRPRLMEAGKMISTEEAERRVLVLQNPGLSGVQQITDTLYAGLQLILPREVARAHRHSQSALRFVIEGTGAFTAVDGERATMHPGDFIITPAWTWHDHGNDSTEPVVWLDGLDVPLVSFLKAGFREEYKDESHPIKRKEGDAQAVYGTGLLPIEDNQRHSTSPVFHYPYSRTRESLYIMSRSRDPDPWQGYALKYSNPTNGDWAIPTIATAMHLLPSGFRTRPFRSTDGVVVTVVEGMLHATVASHEFKLGPKDVLALPAWTLRTLEATAGDTVFFAFSDRPVHEKLGLWRSERRDVGIIS
jgi:gentisate 1,2-dioxygenase